MPCLMQSLWQSMMAEKLKINTCGHGPELVLIHGWAMHSGIWGGVVDALATEYRVNLVDLPGHGVNEAVPLSRELDKVAELLLSELPPAAWIGWSLGGLVTLAAALRQPQQVQKAVLLASTPCFSKQPDWEFGVDASAQQAFSEGLESDFQETLNQFFVQCFGANHVDEALHRLGQSPVTGLVPAKSVMHTGLHLLYSNNLVADSGSCKVPTLFLGGTRDRTIRPESFARAAALMPDAGSSLINAAGHAPFISHQDSFLGIIRRFLQGDQTS